jgi:hypothetical protein
VKRFAVFVLVALAAGACTNRSARVALPSPTIVSASPTPTGIYDPRAPAGGGTYRSKDGRLRFTYPRPWFVIVKEADDVELQDYLLTEAESQRRESNDVYANADGEGYAKVSIARATRTLSAIRREQCKAGQTTLRVRQCTYVSVHSRQALWVLLDVSDDSDCTCRSMFVIANGREYQFEGGGCLLDRCPATRGILRQVEDIFRSAIVS